MQFGVFVCGYPDEGAALPGEHGGEHPRQHADEKRSRLGAHVAGLQGLAYGVVALKTDRQDGEHRGVRHCQLHERHRFT